MTKGRLGAEAEALEGARYDAIIVGAGMSGLFMLHRLRTVGLSALIVDAAAGVGGTWYWNRYPGCRLDSESYTYGYFFAQELLSDWSWSEEFVGQPELERYLNFVVDRLALREHIMLETRVTGASRDESRNAWVVETDGGPTFLTTYLVSATGILSVPYAPPIEGLEQFEGEVHHTGLWPKGGVEFRGRRAAVIGTGSSGVQMIPEIAKVVTSLTVFQRSPNWATPLNNRRITRERAREIQESASEIHKACMSTDSGFLHQRRPESIFDVTVEEREAYLQQLYDEPGLTFLLKNFSDVLIDPRANELVCDFIARQIRRRVLNQSVAELLIPTDHFYGQKRPPMESGYFETYNRDNVELISTVREPILRATRDGLATRDREFALDLIVLATGFDAVTGAVRNLNVLGRNSIGIQDLWAEGPRTFLGMMCAGFPNFFMVGGPQGTQANNPRGTELQVEWIARAIETARRAGWHSLEPSTAAVDHWVLHVNEGASRGLSARSSVSSWALGTNIPGKKRAFLAYASGMQTYIERISDVERRGFADLRAGAM